MREEDKVNLSHFDLIQVLGTGGKILALFQFTCYCEHFTLLIEWNFNMFVRLSIRKWLAYGIVFLVRKRGGKDDGQLYAMKILKKSAIVQKVKTAEHTKTERQVRILMKIIQPKIAFWMIYDMNNLHPDVVNVYINNNIFWSFFSLMFFFCICSWCCKYRR